MTQEVKLQIQYGHRSWTVYKSDPWEYETIERVFKAGDKLEMVGLEGREWSDGCVYDGDDYSIDVVWLKD